MFYLDRLNVEWASVFGVGNSFNTYNLLQGQSYDPWSGGEWYDTEGLYLDIRSVSGHTYLDWLMIRSYSGVEEGDTGAYPMNVRNGGNNLGWNYRPSPVIAMDLDYDPGSSNQYDWGLLLDNSHPADTDVAVTSHDITGTSSAALCSVTDPGRWHQTTARSVASRWDGRRPGLRATATTTGAPSISPASRETSCPKTAARSAAFQGAATT